MAGKKVVKIIAIVSAALLLLVVAAILLVKVLISPEMVKKTILPKVAAAINRPVSLGDVSISIFSGIRLHDLEIRERDNSGPFLKAGAIRLSYRFWPLLSRRVEIDEVVLEAPQVQVIRYPDGTFNYSDLLQKKSSAAQPEPKTPLAFNVSSVAVRDGMVSYDDRRGIAGEPFGTKVSGITIDARQISPEGQFPVTVKANLSGLTAELAGTVTRLTQAPTLDTTLVLAAPDLGKVAAGMPPGIRRKLVPLALTGGITTTLKLAGSVKAPGELLQAGEAQLSAVGLKAGGHRPEFTGALLLARDTVSSKGLAITLGGQQLAIDLNVANLKTRPLNLTLHLNGNQLDLNQLLPTPAQQQPSPPATAAKPEPGPLSLPLAGNGTIRLGTLLYRNLQVAGLSLDWQLRDNVLTIAGLKGNLAGGNFTDTARIDLGVKGFAYTTNLAVQGVQADQLLPAFAPKTAGSVFGTMTLGAQLAGRGTANARRNLTGNGTFGIDNGKLTGTGFIQTLAQFLGSEQLRVIRFSRLAGTYAIKNELVNLDAGLKGSDARMLVKGIVGFDKSIDLGIDARFPPTVAGRLGRGDLGRLLTDSDGWSGVPLRATGTFGAPRFMVDAAQMKGKVRETVQRKLEEKLFGKEPQGQQQPARELLDKGLRGIFGN